MREYTREEFLELLEGPELTMEEFGLLIDTQEVADRVGVSRASVYTWFARHPDVIPLLTIGRKHYYWPADIDESNLPKIRPDCECHVCRGLLKTRHGSSCYVNYGCRCGICTRSATIRNRKYKKRVRRGAARQH